MPGWAWSQMITLLVASHLPWHWHSASAAHSRSPAPASRAWLPDCMSQFPPPGSGPRCVSVSKCTDPGPAEGAWQCPAPAVYIVYSLYSLYTCGEMSECDDTPSQLGGVTFLVRRHMLFHVQLSLLSHTKGDFGSRSRFASVSNIVSIDNEACNFQFTRLKFKCYVGGWIVMIWLIK